MIGARVVAIAAIAGCASAPPRKMPGPPRPDACVGDTVPSVAPIAVEGYPVPRGFADKPARDARAAELEAKVPGWKLVVDSIGFPTSATLPAAGVPASALAARVTELFDHLASVYRLDARPEVEVVHDAVSLHYHGVDAGIDLRQDGASIIVTASRRHRIEVPNGAHEISDGELFVRWGGFPRNVRIVVPPEVHPCDRVPGYPNACSQPDARVECVSAFSLVRRADIETSDGFRRVIYLDIPSITGCGSPQHEPTIMTTSTYCTVATPVPRCMDAVTGETLADDCGAIP